MVELGWKQEKVFDFSFLWNFFVANLLIKDPQCLHGNICILYLLYLSFTPYVLLCNDIRRAQCLCALPFFWAPKSVSSWQNHLQVNEIFAKNAIDAVMHFAAVAYVSESMAEPLRWVLTFFLCVTWRLLSLHSECLCLEVYSWHMGVHHRKITYTLKVGILLQVLECNAVHKALTYMKSPDDTVAKAPCLPTATYFFLHPKINPRNLTLWVVVLLLLAAVGIITTLHSILWRFWRQWKFTKSKHWSTPALVQRMENLKRCQSQRIHPR